MSRSAAHRPEVAPLKHARWFVALAAMGASVAGLRNDFVYDDKAILVDVDRLQGLSQWRDILTLPYWPPPFQDSLYRPLTSLLLALEYTVGGGAPVVFRLVSLALYCLSAGLFHGLARRLVGPTAALAAALLWAVHPVHVEAVAQGVNQAELLVGCFAMLMAIRYLDARRTGVVPARIWFELATLFALATATKESGFIMPALLLLVELVLVEGSVAQRARLLWRGYAGFAVVAAASLWIRSAVLSGETLTGNTAIALRGADLPQRMFAMLQVVPMWLRLFVWPVRLQVDFSPAELGMPDFFGVSEAAGLMLLVATAAFLAWSRHRLPIACFGIAWCAVALLPVSNIVPVYFLLAERTLFLPSVGFFIAVAAVGSWVVANSTWRRTRRSLVAVCGILCMLAIIRSTSRHLVWNSAHISVRRR